MNNKWLVSLILLLSASKLLSVEEEKTTTDLATSLTQGATTAATGIPPMNFDFSGAFDFSKREIDIDQTCYGYVDNSGATVIAEGGQAAISTGACTQKAEAAMGKIGDVKEFNLDQLGITQRTTNKLDLGKVSFQKLSFDGITVPATGDQNMAYVKFIPADPKGSRIAPTSALRGKATEVLFRTVQFTPQVALREGKKFKENHVLLEFWGRTYPSVTGKKAFKQFYNLPVPISQIGKALALGVNDASDVVIGWWLKKGEEYWTTGTNITSQSP